MAQDLPGRTARQDTAQLAETWERRRSHFNACVNDTVFFIPQLADAVEDRELLRHVGRRVTDIITEVGLSPGKDRKREVRKRLKAFEKDLNALYKEERKTHA